MVVVGSVVEVAEAATVEAAMQCLTLTGIKVVLTTL